MPDHVLMNLVTNAAHAIGDRMGTITVESQPGQGTRFDFYFPVAAGNVAATTANAA